MMIKCTGLFCLCFPFFLACGQNHKNAIKISRADSILVKSYEDKSILYRTKEPDSAIYFADKGLRLSRRLHYLPGEARLLSNLARINEQFGNLKQALKYQKEALNLFKGLHDSEGVAGASVSMGLLEGKQGYYNEGIQLIQAALKQYRKNKDKRGMVSAYSTLGEIDDLRGDTAKALLDYSRAEVLYKGLPVTDEYLSLINAIGKLHGKSGNHRQAANYYAKGIDKSTSKEHVRAHIAFLNAAGKTSDHLGDKQSALAYHKQGLQKAKNNGLHEEEARSLIGIASTLKDQDAGLSIKHLQNALTISRSLGHKQLTAEIYMGLSNIYRQQSRYKDALNALEEHHNLTDSVLNENKGHKIAVLQSSYELAESKLKVETLELANREKTYQRNVGLLIAISILIILLVVVIYFYKTNRLNRRLQASNLVKDKLFTVIGHDLRNPIGGITRVLTIMGDGDLSVREQQHMVSEMSKQGNIILEILNALLSWGEAQLKGIHIKPANFMSKPIISRNIEMLDQQAADKSIIITDHTPPELLINGDMNHFDFIIRNLISNAVKFSNFAGVVEISAVLKTNREAVFSVTDHGKGISKKQQELFFRSNLDVSFGTVGEKGTGIGLLLTKEYINANHGKIWIESEEGKGARFNFTFKMASERDKNKSASAEN
jgi:signal transduction histidine kinase